MPYRDRLRPGSFRGVPFYTPSSEREGGQRGAVQEYPGSDDYTAQELGRGLTTFSVTAIVIGPDYDLDRDALIAALEQGGPGRLVHRYYGEFDAMVEPGKRYRVVESEQEGGKATFTIPFIRAPKAAVQAVGADSAQRVRLAATSARTAAASKFDRDVDTSGPEFVRDAIVATITGASSAVAAVNRKINGALAITSGVQAAITTLGNSVAALVASPLVLIQLRQNLMDIQGAMFESIADVGQSLRDVREAFGGIGLEAANAETQARKLAFLLTEALGDVAGYDEPALDDSTELNARMATNQAAVIRLVQTSAAIEAAVASLDMPYDSSATAEATRDRIADALNTLAGLTDDDDVYASLRDLLVEVHAHLTAAARALPTPAEYVPHTVMPALLVAHLVHGDARRCEEIIARNNIRHPGFVRPAVPLQVLDR